MKKIIILLVLFIGFKSFSQNIFYDDFSTFNLAKLDGQGGYSSASPSQGNGTGNCFNFDCNVKIKAQVLSYPNFGNCTQALNPIDGTLATGDGPGKSLGSPITSGSVYVALLINLNSPLANATTAKQVVRFMDNSFTTATRIYTKMITGGGGFQIGVDKNGSATVYGSNSYGYGQDHLVILKYQFNAGTNTNDVASVFIDPDMSLPEPTATVSAAAGTDATTINRIAFPWNSSTTIPNGLVGIVSTSQSWAGLLPPPVVTNYSISGNIKSANGLTINGVKVKIASSNATDSVSTNAGDYTKGNLPNASYVIRPSKNNDITKANGVNSTDVLFVQRHILNTTKITNPYKLLAADVTGDKAINSVDILRMKRLILGTDTTFSSTLRGNRLWEFIDSAYVFPDTTNPYTFKDSISLNTLASNAVNQSFIGVKLGDVVYNWTNTISKGVKLSNVTFNYSSSNCSVSNCLVKIPVTTNNFIDVNTVQYTLHFNNTLYEFVGIENNKMGFDFNSNKANATGNIAMLWLDKNAQAKSFANGTQAFTLVFKKKDIAANNEDDVLSLNNEITITEAYNSENQKLNIAFNKVINNIKNNTLVTYPNPSKNVLNLNINALKNEMVKIEVIDMFGKKASQFNKQIIAGNNNLSCNIQSLCNGVYFVNVVSADGNTTSSKFIKQ